MKKCILFVLLAVIALTSCKNSYYSYELSRDKMYMTYKVVTCIPINVDKRNPDHRYCLYVTGYDGSGTQYRVFTNKEYKTGDNFTLIVKGQ